MAAHMAKPRRITVLYVSEPIIETRTFDDWESFAIWINDFGFEGRNITIAAWEYEDDAVQQQPD